ncbi:MAG TPA: nucleotidyltransferase family protein [Aestuariivirga sp.]|nr:nucleotidyltransferase family protein [Aestuariivirga sp.]
MAARSPWHAVVLAAGRGPDDPMARAYGITHKAGLMLAGKPMLLRVVEALRQSPGIASITVVLENEKLLADILGDERREAGFAPAQASAPASAMAAIRRLPYPVLVTTGDHALLTPAMVEYVLDQAERNEADAGVALATAETITAQWPETRRTYFVLGPDRVSGCNLFAIRTARGLKLLDRWQYLEAVRKKPWRLVAAFGLKPLWLFLTGGLNLDRAFRLVSQRLGLTVRPILMPFAEAAMDVDKPSDKELAETILLARAAALATSAEKEA